MTTPIIGAPELVSAQAIPETTVNEIARYLEQGALWFGKIKDRDLATPPASPADGDAYIVAASPTGAWAGQAGKIAFRVSTSWLFITPTEGMAIYVADEDAAFVYDGAAFVSLAGGSGASTTQTEEMIAGFIASPSNKDYRIVVKMAHGFTITETTTRSASGTCTATFKINTTALGGTANSVSSTEQSQAHASSNVGAAGDDVVLTISANSSCADLSFSIKYTRTLA